MSCNNGNCGAQWALKVCKGRTFSEVYRWEAAPVIYKAVTGVPQRTPLRLTVPSHGFPDGWRLAVSDVVGMTEINAEHEPPRSSAYRRATVVDSNTLEFNDVNAASYGVYVSGGYVRGNTPVDMTAYTAALVVYESDADDAAVLATWSAYVAIDNAAKTITLTLSDAVTDALTFETGYYELVLESPGGVVTELLRGDVEVQA